MKKTICLLSTIAVMLLVSLLVVLLVDATVQIDDDPAVLLLLLLIVNAAIAWIGRRLYRAAEKEEKPDTDTR